MFWSDSVNRRIFEREEKSEKARLSAKTRWNNANASKNNANALRDESDGNAIKESKVNKVYKFIIPSNKEIEDYFKELNRPEKMQKFINHYSANGWMVGKNKMKDWKAAARNSLDWSGGSSNVYNGKKVVDESNNPSLY